MTAKQRVFISFDYDNDGSIKDLLVGQAKNTETPFEFSDWSIKEHLTGDWEKKAQLRMRSVDVVCVLCGVNTHTAKGVSAELSIAQNEEIPYFFLAAYADRNCSKPVGSRQSDKIYKWTWPNVEALINGAR